MKLEEAFFDYKPAPVFLSKTVGKIYPIFVDPTKKELKEVGDEGFRFLADAKAKKLYAFSIYILHQFAANDFMDGVDLYKTPHILAGTIGKNGQVEDLVPFGEDAKEVFNKEYYKEFKKQDWDWLDKYFDTSVLKEKLAAL